MAYVELYDKDILDLVSLGKTSADFEPVNGDYIRVDVYRSNTNSIIKSLFSNKLLLKNPNTDDYYLDDYHYHPDNKMMGICSGKNHSDDSITNMVTVPVGNAINDVSNTSVEFKKQVDIFKDDGGNVYIKPNEILKLLNLDKGKYNLKINFLRDIKSTLGYFLNLNSNNLIENGNFFAGLEATQAGDIDKSIGHNFFNVVSNPGYSPHVLEQNGVPGNTYVMKVTGVEPSSSYVFSCWAAWNTEYNGGKQIVKFTNDTNTDVGLPQVPNTDFGGTWKTTGDITDNKTNRHIKEGNRGGLIWKRYYSIVKTDETLTSGNILVKVGGNYDGWGYSTKPLGRRYFTDLRLVKIDNVTDDVLDLYLKNLNNEVDMYSGLDYYTVKTLTISDINTINKENEISPELKMNNVPNLDLYDIENQLKGTLGNNVTTGNTSTTMKKGGRFKK